MPATTVPGRRTSTICSVRGKEGDHYLLCRRAKHARVTRIQEDGEPNPEAYLVPADDVYDERLQPTARPVGATRLPLQGIETGRLGVWLTELLRQEGSPLFVAYDHGQKGAGQNVHEVKGFCGEVVSNMTRIKGIDLIVGALNGTARVVVEVEERPIATPDLFRDACAILACDGFAVGEGKRQRIFRPDDRTLVIVAGVMPDDGCRLAKVLHVESRLREGGPYPRGIDPQNVELIFEAQLGAALARLRTRLRQLTTGRLSS